MVTYRATLDVPEDLVSWLENLIATRRGEAGGSWRALTSWDQAILVLVWFIKGDSYPELGRHFGIGTETARRYVEETVDALAGLAPDLSAALAATGSERRVLPDGTLIPAWRCAAVATEDNPDPLYNAKHRRHGMNVQALTSSSGELLFLGTARPGSVHDLAAARADDIIDAATAAGVEIIADTGYTGAGGTCRTPARRPKGKGHNGWEKKANAAHARERAPAERPFADLKRCRLLDKLRISPSRVTQVLKALLVINRKQTSLSRA